jgi:hypothetical protein
LWARPIKDKARWMELCERAAVERDPQKVLELVTKMNRLLLEKEKRIGIVLPLNQPDLVNANPECLHIERYAMRHHVR